ncbi:MAG: M20/M25/M40 family metallo-hydrolase [Gammaproteobacteria bacterium]|nr:M20/M25/M40 family metallo-hydrolase [Gammaproteobacteria bacterium]
MITGLPIRINQRATFCVPNALPGPRGILRITLNNRPGAIVKDRTNEPAIDAREILEGILRWVRIESPSHDGDAVNRMVSHIEEEMRAVGARIERHDGEEGYGDTLIARSPWEGDEPGILVLSHSDTVHPIGTIENELKVRQEGDKVYGPGIYDMKGGAYLAYYALRHLVRSERRTKLPITFMYVPEEEVGSPTSRKLIEAEAKKHRYVLVTEPARDGGKIVTARKGAARFKLEAIGQPAHAGLRHMDGRSAIKEIAHQVLVLESMTDYEQEVTLNVGVISGGTGINVVPAACVAEVDMRVPTPELGEEMCERVLGLTAHDPDVTLLVTGGMNRPPYEKDAGIAKLHEHARRLAKDIGFELDDVKTGGGSDGNFTAALGIPTLDGLGVDGHGAHAHNEHLLYSSLEPRTKLLLKLFETLE